MKTPLHSFNNIQSLSLACLFFLMTIGSSNSFATVRTWDGGGSDNLWTNATNWSGNEIPTISDTVIFNATSTKNCVINDVARANRFTIESTYTGTISAPDAVLPAIQDPTIDLRIAGPAVFAGGTFNWGNSTKRTMTVLGLFTVSGTNFTAPRGKLEIGSDFTVIAPGAFSHNAGSVEFTGPLTITGGPSFFNLTFVPGTSSTIYTLSDSLSVVSNFSIAGDLATTIAGGKVKLAGNFAFSGAGAKSLNSNFILNGSSQSTNSDLLFGGNLTIGTGSSTTVFDNLGFTIAATNVGTGSLTVNAGATLRLGALTTLPFFNSYSFNATSTLEYYGPGPQTVATGSFGNLTISGARGGSTVTLATGAIYIAGIFTPSATNVVYSFNTNNQIVFNGTTNQNVPAFTYKTLVLRNSATKTFNGNINIEGNLTDETTDGFTPNKSTVTFAGSDTLQGMAGPKDPMVFSNLTITNPFGTRTYRSTVIDSIYSSTGTVGLIIFPFFNTPNTLTFRKIISTGAIVTGGPKADLRFANSSGYTNLGTLKFNQANDTTKVIRDLTMNSLADNGNVTLGNAVKVVGTVTLTSGTVISGGNMTLDLNTGLVAQDGDGSITGDISVVKNVNHGYFTLVSSPLSGVTASDWTNDFSSVIKYYDESSDVLPANSTGWKTIASPSFPGQGFGLNKAPSGAAPLRITGTYDHNPPLEQVGNVEAEAVSLPVSYTTPDGVTASANREPDGWNLIGNPYPSAIDWDVVSLSLGSLSKSIYIYDGDDNSENRRYISYNGDVSSPLGISGLDTIAPMQGFWYKLTCTTGTCRDTIRIANAARVTSRKALYREEAIQSDVLNLHLEGNNSMDGTVVRLRSDGGLGVDPLDAIKRMNEGSVPSFYTRIAGDKFAINTLPEDYNRPILLGYNVQRGGNYKIKAVDVAKSNSFSKLTLTDTKLGITQDLMVSPEYQFEAIKGDTTSRFYINFVSTVTSNIENEAMPKVSIGGDGKKVYIKSNSASLVTADIVLYDVLGKEAFRIQGADIQRSISFEPNINMGVYSVKIITTGNNQYNGKISINR